MGTAINPVTDPPAAVTFAFKSTTLQAEREALCKRVVRHFQQHPTYRLLCYVDDERPTHLPAMDYLPTTHRSFGGCHVPVKGGGKWPDYIQQLLFTAEHKFAFDNLIYIPGTIYSGDPVAFVLILAHELQHFVQYGESELAYRVNSIMSNNISKFDPNAKVWDLPDERDAMIVSKRVTEVEFGTSGLRQLMERQIDDAITNRNLSKKEVWMFLSGLPSAVYNWLAETSSLVEKYRPLLVASLSEEEMGLVNALSAAAARQPV